MGGTTLKFVGSRRYSTVINNKEVLNSNPNDQKDLSDSEFYDWLRGFTDGEGSYIIVPSRKSFYFRFTINLHKDDTPGFLSSATKQSSNPPRGKSPGGAAAPGRGKRANKILYINFISCAYL